jgi:hypothetical protein
MNIPSDVCTPERRLDVIPMPDRDGGDGRSEDREGDAIRQCEIGCQADGSNFRETSFVETEVGVEDLEDVDALKGEGEGSAEVEEGDEWKEKGQLQYSTDEKTEGKLTPNVELYK